MLFEEFLHKDIRRVGEELGIFREQIMGSFELNNLVNKVDGRNQLLHKQARDFKAAAIDQINRALESLVRIEEESADPDSVDLGRCGIFFLVCIQSLENEVADFQNQLTAAQTQVANTVSMTKAPPASQQANPIKLVISWLKNNLLPRLRQVLKRAWQIACNLLTPTRWVVRGDVGSEVFGLSNAGLEITFETEGVRVPFTRASVSTHN